jgi:hypothetical protein
LYTRITPSFIHDSQQIFILLNMPVLSIKNIFTCTDLFKNLIQKRKNGRQRQDQMRINIAK